MSSSISNFFSHFANSLAENHFIKLNLGNYHGNEQDLKKILIKKIRVKNKAKLSFVYRYQTRDITKNYDPAKGLSLIKSLVDTLGFRHANLFTIKKDYELLLSPKGDWKINDKPPTIKDLPDTNHDKNKHRKIISVGKQYLYDLKITDTHGKVRTHGQDKYRQINHYIEILSSLLEALPQKKLLNIVDMGSGKGYLTFALYDYLNNVQNTPAHITGVEYRKDLVDLCNTIASNAQFNDLNFVEGTIENYHTESDLDVLIALHACDTATDDAIYKGILGKAELVVVAPCCHKQIRSEMQKTKVVNNTTFLTKHGIFMERQAEMVTDGLRALLLESMGYTTKVFEFISTEHTPKNVLIVAQKRKSSVNNKDKILKEIADSKSFFGVKKHHLEELLYLNER